MHDRNEKTTPMDLATASSADHVLVTVQGVIDHSTEHQLREHLRSLAMGLGAKVLVLDLSAVTFFGSVALTILLQAADDAARHSTATHPFRVVVDNSRPVIRPLQITGLQSLIRLHHRLDEALSDDQPSDLQ